MDVIRALSREIATTLPQQEAAFRREFPDFAFAGRVYFMYALGAFDGAVRTVEGRDALLFGLDVIAAIHGSGASVAPLFHHELFHAYHGPLIGDTGRGLPLYLSVWTEGLATLVARQLNPSASDAAIFGLPPNTPQRTRADLPRLASLLRAKLDSTSPEDYDAFFIGNEPDAALPRRSGYYLGYLVAARIQQGRPLRDLARLKGPELRQAIADALAAPETLVEARRAVTARVWGDPRDRGAHAPHGMLGSVARRRPAPGPRFVHGLARTPDVECRHRVPRSVRTPLSVLRQWLTRRNSPLLRNGPLPRRADAFRFP